MTVVITHLFPKPLCLAAASVLCAAGIAAAQPPATGTPAPRGSSAAVSPAQPASATTWRVDSGHSSAAFSVKHMMVSTVRGSLGPVSGTVEYDGQNLASIRADVTIDVTRIATGNESRDRDLRGSGFFEVDRYPVATFKSTGVEPAGPGRFRLAGMLTLHGVSKPVVLDVEGPSPAVRMQNGGQKIGASATTRINRRDFGLNYNSVIEAGPVVGDEVTVTIDLELNR